MLYMAIAANNNIPTTLTLLNPRTEGVVVCKTDPRGTR